MMPTGMEDYGEPFGAYFGRKLGERGLSQNQAARRMGVTSGMVNAWVHDQRTPSPGSIVKIASLLAVGVDELMIRAGHRKPVETDLHPLRRELLEVARQLPLNEAQRAIEYLVWRTQQASLKQFQPKRAGDHTSLSDDETTGQLGE